MSDLFSIEVESDRDIPVVVVRGEVDLSNVHHVERAIDAAADPESAGLIVDLSELDYLDSAGVRLLFQVARTVTPHIVLVVPESNPVWRVLDLANVSSVVPVVPARSDALTRLG